MPHDLVQLHRPRSSDMLTLRTTSDNSSTQLELTVRTWDWSGASITLGVQDAQVMAGALLQWLAENGHELPELPPELELADYADDGTEQPATTVHVVPEHTRTTHPVWGV